MTLKSYLLLSGGGLLATYLVTSQPGVTPERPAARTTARSAPATVDIQEEAARLETRVRQEVEYREPSRNPFVFGARQAARPSAPAVHVPVDAPPPVEPEAPPIRLLGVASADGKRTAFLATPQGLVEVREGDTVTQDLSAGTPERRSFYRVGRIEEDAVELVGSDGTSRRLLLRP